MVANDEELVLLFLLFVEEEEEEELLCSGIILDDGTIRSKVVHIKFQALHSCRSEE